MSTNLPQPCCNRLRFEAEDGSTISWPDPRDPMEIQWKLRYGNPTKSDLLNAAQFLDAYGHLFYLDVRTRNLRMRQVKEAMAATPNPPEHSQPHYVLAEKEVAQ